jgi:hypothetical protein
MRDPEQELRNGLAVLAEEADTSPRVVREVVGRARVAAVRRRRSALAVVGAAAAVVLVVAGLGALRMGQSGGDRAAPPTSPPLQAPQVPGGYRLELWHDLGIFVPATWGWGSAPTRTPRGDVVRCGTGVVQQDGHRDERADLPYVGRPIEQPGACDSEWAVRTPRAPYVWFDGEVPLGTVRLGGGWVRQTVEVAGVRVSVATDDAALRAAILRSAHRVQTACAPTLANPPRPRGTVGGDFVPVSMTVCAYAATGAGRDYELVYGQDLTMGPAKYLVDAVDRAPSLGSFSCSAARGGEWALLRLHGEGGASRDYVADMACPSIADPSGTQHPLTVETVTPWAVGGVNAVLHTHPAITAPDRFIPPLR